MISIPQFFIIFYYELSIVIQKNEFEEKKMISSKTFVLEKINEINAHVNQKNSLFFP